MIGSDKNPKFYHNVNMDSVKKTFEHHDASKCSTKAWLMATENCCNMLI